MELFSFMYKYMVHNKSVLVSYMMFLIIFYGWVSIVYPFETYNKQYDKQKHAHWNDTYQDDVILHVLCTIGGVLCTIGGVLCTIGSVLCTIGGVLCTIVPLEQRCGCHRFWKFATGYDWTTGNAFTEATIKGLEKTVQ